MSESLKRTLDEKERKRKAGNCPPSHPPTITYTHNKKEFEEERK
jgi:hypothetical protein